jgi:hypothetical protein
MQSIINTMETTETKASSKTDAGRYITLVAYRPKTQLPVTARPCPDHTGMVWTGQGEHGYYDLLTEDEKKKLGYVVTPNTAIILEDGKVFDLRLPKDAANWKWLQKHPYISMDRAVGENDRDKCFHVANPLKEAEQRNDSMEKVDEARYKIRLLSESERNRVARILGLGNPEAHAPQQVLDWLLGKATDRLLVKAVLDAMNPENKGKSNAQIFFNDAVKWGVFERMKDGAYYFGGETGFSVGLNDAQVIDYLLNKDNAERVKVMKSVLAEKTKTAVVD